MLLIYITEIINKPKDAFFKNDTVISFKTNFGIEYLHISSN